MTSSEPYAIPVGPVEVQTEAAAESYRPSLEGGKKDDEEGGYRVLIENEVSRLPQRFQRILEGNVAEEEAEIFFFPGFVPAPPIFWIVLGGIPMAGFIAAIALYKDVPDTLVPLIVVFVPFSAFVLFGIARGMILRKPLNVPGKPFPGDWKGGVYLVGNEALLQFDPLKEKVWLFPTTKILKVDHKIGQHQKQNSYMEIILTVKSPPRHQNETFNQTIDVCNSLKKAPMIIKWCENCIQSRME